jgi:uncharacterized protein involved in exopolysaccharide biosynthesis
MLSCRGRLCIRKHYETANKPIFSIFDPVTIPNGREGNNGGLIILLSTIFGVVVSFIYIFAWQFFRGIKEKRN